MKPQMTEACRDLVEGVQHRMKRAKRQALLHPRADRQRFIYDNTFRNEIEAVAYFLAENIGRIPDFNTPETYPELMRGQFLTHPNPLMSIAADKIAMRDYCDLFDLPIRPPTSSRHSTPLMTRPARSARNLHDQDQRWLQNAYPARAGHAGDALRLSPVSV